MILITGATGGVGRAVLEAVSKSGKPCRAMIRAASDVGKAGGAATVVVADFSDKESLKRALAGIDTVFLVCSPIPALVELEGNMIDACATAGVKHIVLNSALGAGDYPKSFPSWHRQVEDKLKSSGIGFTIFRPNGFMQNILAYNAPSIASQGAFYSSMGDARISYIDARDIAAVIAKALTAPAAHAGQTYELNGPEPVSNAELAGRISKVTGKTVQYIDIPEEAQRKAMLDAGMPQWQVTAILELQDYYKTGKGATVTDVLPNLLGRAPTRLDAFLEEFKSAFTAH